MELSIHYRGVAPLLYTLSKTLDSTCRSSNSTRNTIPEIPPRRDIHNNNSIWATLIRIILLSNPTHPTCINLILLKFLNSSMRCFNDNSNC